MPDYNSIDMLPIAAGVSLLGLIVTFFVARRRGPAAGMRGVAWSLLPIALYFTGLLPILWTAVTSVVHLVANLAFSPKIWLGLILLAVAVVLWISAGAMRTRGVGVRTKEQRAERREQRRAAKSGTSANAGDPAAADDAETAAGGPAGELTRSASRPAATAQKSQASAATAKKDAGDDGEFDEIEDILKRHGIS